MQVEFLESALNSKIHESLVNMCLFIHSFWLDAHAVPARVALGVTTLLTMSTQTASINSALPPVAYTKAIDVWQV